MQSLVPALVFSFLSEVPAGVRRLDVKWKNIEGLMDTYAACK